MAKPILDATLSSRRDFNDTLSLFRFELEGGVPDFEPGSGGTTGCPDPDRLGMRSRTPAPITAPGETPDIVLAPIRLPRFSPPPEPRE